MQTYLVMDTLGVPAVIVEEVVYQHHCFYAFSGEKSANKALVSFFKEVGIIIVDRKLNEYHIRLAGKHMFFCAGCAVLRSSCAYTCVEHGNVSRRKFLFPPLK